MLILSYQPGFSVLYFTLDQFYLPEHLTFTKGSHPPVKSAGGKSFPLYNYTLSWYESNNFKVFGD